MTLRSRVAQELDPDDIEARPPEEAQEAKWHFQTGEHMGKWSGFDERGVPHLNAKGKKLTKQEKELVETEYLEAKKAYQQQIKAKEQWERALEDAEKALREKDRVRWAYRAAGPSRHALLHIEDLEDFVKKMGWEAFSHKDMEALQSVAARQGPDAEELLLEDVRQFISEEMASKMSWPRWLSSNQTPAAQMTPNPTTESSRAVLDPYGGILPYEDTESTKWYGAVEDTNNLIKEELTPESFDGFQWIPATQCEVTWDVLQVPERSDPTKVLVWAKVGEEQSQGSGNDLILWEAPDKEGLKASWTEVQSFAREENTKAQAKATATQPAAEVLGKAEVEAPPAPLDEPGQAAVSELRAKAKPIEPKKPSVSYQRALKQPASKALAKSSGFAVPPRPPRPKPSNVPRAFQTKGAAEELSYPSRFSTPVGRKQRAFEKAAQIDRAPEMAKPMAGGKAWGGVKRSTAMPTRGSKDKRTR
ncbi:unnamed protein product [Symbiodinium sp. CCMP2592]|nr:unnamed protein product [Symbiodinium sp. CCMP2592]